MYPSLEGLKMVSYYADTDFQRFRFPGFLKDPSKLLDLIRRRFESKLMRRLHAGRRGQKISCRSYSFLLR